MMYQISNFKFNIINHDHINIPENMNKFIVDKNDSNYQYDIYITNDIYITESHFIINKPNIKICSNGIVEKRYLYLHGDNKPYAVSEEIDDKHTIINIHKDYIHMMIIDTIFVSLLSLERRMNKYHQYILHSAYIVENNQAILFTAPSGTGKSTQAALWQKHKDSRIVNGDRTLISKEKNKYFANGWPICGSSEICINEKYPIAAIVVLSQGKENTITELKYSEAFKKILSELTINYHNSLFVNDVMNFIEDLISHVKIYHLTCDISEDAVNCLEKRLKEDDLWMR